MDVFRSYWSRTKIIDLNKENKNVEVCADNLEYFHIHETQLNSNTTKQNLVTKLMDEKKGNH